MIIAIIIVVALLVIFIISSYNNFIKQREMVKNSKGQVATQIESRWDAITNLIEATKSYQKHEDVLLRDITMSRSNVDRNSNIEDLEKNDELFKQAVDRLNFVVENYPDLKASEVYQNTMTQVDKYENNVRHSRMIYNDTVTKFNTNIQTFPNNLIAGIFNFKEEEYFQNVEEKYNTPSW
ncbi:LemA family protein [Miniphocaeibacter halophilus]|uniref:LemA family protein n=1 Tax=Miniphocaeibacter halophilus TaxID=2931922 RepID=A0AC61MP64_9FIRM|nr:LemA family protein [Miniphocaeibacter halophilus]QQK07302.1 LemA family protein [Miniphocaeibacter halophilus]